MNLAMLQGTKSMYRNWLCLIHQEWSNIKRNKETDPIYNAPRVVKYVGINLSKEVKDLYAENYRRLVKEIEEDTEKAKKHSMLVDWKKKYWRNVNRTQCSPHIICSTNHIAPALFSKLEQAIIKCVWNHKGPWIAKELWRRKPKWEAPQCQTLVSTTKL